MPPQFGTFKQAQKVGKSDLRCFATTHATQQHPSDVWFGEIITGDASADINLKRLTRLNSIAEETFALSPSERISYQSVDGWRIDALFTPPLEHKSDMPPPLVVNVHGGPSWAWLDDFGSNRTQTLASADYAVLRANIRGSWGCGVAFTRNRESLIGICASWAEALSNTQNFIASVQP